MAPAKPGMRRSAATGTAIPGHETAAPDNGCMLPHGFHWLDDKCRLLLRGRALVLIEPTASPVSLSVLVPGEPPTSKYFVSHELAIAYAERWATKHEAGIRLHVPHAQGATTMA